MVTSIINTAVIKKMLSLQEKKESLESQIAVIDSELVSLFGRGQSLVVGDEAKPTPAKRGRKPGRKPGRKAQKKATRGPGRPRKIATVAAAKPITKTAKAKKKSTRGPGRPRKTAGVTTPAKNIKKVAKPAGRRGRKRGETGSKIMKVLAAVGKDGVSVQELAKKLKIKPQNLYVWFNSTGRKVDGLKKVGKARYALKG